VNPLSIALNPVQVNFEAQSVVRSLLIDLIEIDTERPFSTNPENLDAHGDKMFPHDLEQKPTGTAGPGSRYW